MFDIYLEMLLDWNTRMNLTAITEPEEVRIKHFEDSLACLKTGRIREGDSVIDIGTGAGFPGLPLKIAMPSLRLTLMDALQKRVRFLRAVTDELKLEGVSCIHMRAEEAGKNSTYRQQYDVAVSRAVANMALLSEYCLPLVKEGGFFLAMKGPDAKEELENALPLIKRLGGTVREVYPYTLSGDIHHTVIVIEKTAPTPKGYPRNAKKAGTI